ncbi:MAG: PaaI family thioesterase [Prevotella sp.]|nr:PaaI family thioesterase [Prevotella sp.]
MKKILNPWTNREGYDCFGCCPTNPYGVHMEFFEEGDDIVSFWKPRQHYQGWINTMHGGILSTLVDEIAGWVVSRKLQTSGMTTRLDVRYKKAVSTLDPRLTIRGHIAEMKRNIAFIDVTIKNSKGEVCVEGQATYFCMNAERAKEMGFEECKTEEE